MADKQYVVSFLINNCIQKQVMRLNIQNVKIYHFNLLNTLSTLNTLNKHELKLELTNRGLDGHGKTVDLINRLTKTISKIP